MTPEEAIETIEVARAEVEWEYPMNYAVAFDAAIEALKKEIPAKPIGDLNSVPHYRCPTCHRTAKLYEDSNVFDNCIWCGQSLKWDCD